MGMVFWIFMSFFKTTRKPLPTVMDNGTFENGTILRNNVRYPQTLTLHPIRPMIIYSLDIVRLIQILQDKTILSLLKLVLMEEKEETRDIIQNKQAESAAFCTFIRFQWNMPLEAVVLMYRNGVNDRWRSLMARLVDQGSKLFWIGTIYRTKRETQTSKKPRIPSPKE